MKIKVKGGPHDGKFVSGHQLEPELTIAVSELLNGKPVIVFYHYRLESYITTRFGGRRFYRYVYQDHGRIIELFDRPAAERK